MTVALDASQKQTVSYCIPEWLRDLQIQQSIKRVTGRIQPAYEPRTESVAIVGFGPSLQDTWEQVRNYPVIVSCSGSHKFLLERGIVPTYHVEVDPRPHKVQLIGPPHQDVTYLIASACHKAVFDHLEGFNVLLWHVFDGNPEAVRALPYGEWSITGGCDVGLRAMTLAAFLGFRDLHVFGMDGCGRESSHAGEHPNAVKKYAPCEYEGKTYQTTPALLEAARGVLHELKQMPGVRATFYGEGLIQAMTRGYQPTKEAPAKFANVVGFVKPQVISAPYRELNRTLHETNLAYGVGGGKHAKPVLSLATALKTTSILDYGCGKGYLAKEIPFPIWEYDPAIPGKDSSPRPADLVVCTDVLEHIEPDHLDAVLHDLKRVVKRLGYFVINTGPASKTLPDGRNTHLIQQDREWWRNTLGRFFHVKLVPNTPGNYVHAVVEPKRKA